MSAGSDPEALASLVVAPTTVYARKLLDSHKMVADSLREKLTNAGQEHLLQFWDELTQEEQQNFTQQVDCIDLEAVNSYFRRIKESESNPEKVDGLLEPLEPDVCGYVNRTPAEQLVEYYNIGLEKIANGEVAVLLLAGGQGTRLGSDNPKGMYNVGLPSRKCLYQIQGERLYKVEQLAAKQYNRHGAIPWYIMTSEATKEKTSEYFAKKHFFGLNRDNVVFFEQSTLPCLTLDGKIILETKSKIATAPDGNGGLYRALGVSGVLDDMIKRGVKYVHVYCVDNILVKMADPVFIGFCITKNAQCGNKVVEKTSPTEAVGVVGKVKGRYQVVEYSEITLKTAQLRSADGRLKYNAGNICNHFFTIDFLTDVVRNHDAELMHHVAKKKIPYVNAEGQCVKPNSNNGIKMEKFVFDVFRFADRFCAWEVLREDEFAALKNADGSAECTPTTCRHALYNLHYRFIINAGGRFGDNSGTPLPEIPGNVSPVIDENREKPDFPNGNSPNGHACSPDGKSSDSGSDDEHTKTIVVEISPLVTYAGEGLNPLVSGKVFTPPLIIASDKESVGRSRIRKPSFLVDHC